MDVFKAFSRKARQDAKKYKKTREISSPSPERLNPPDPGLKLVFIMDRADSMKDFYEIPVPAGTGQVREK